MGVILSVLFQSILHIVNFALPTLLAAWLLTLVLPLSFSQALWLSLGMILVVRYIIQTIGNIPGETGVQLIQSIVSVLAAFILLALSGLFGWLLSQFGPLDLTLFEATVLFSISLTAGFFFSARADTIGFSSWLALHDLEFEDEFENDEYITPPPKRQSKRGRKPSRGRTN